MSEAPIDVLVALREELLRRGVRDVLEAEEDVAVVGVFGEVAETLEALADLRPAVALVDVAFREGGTSFLPDARAASPETALIVMVDHDADQCLLRHARAGDEGWALSREALEHVEECCLTSLRDEARGCVPRSATPDRLVAAVRMVLDGRIAADEWALGSWLIGSGRAPGRPAESHITARELQVIRLVAEGCSNKAIASRLDIHEQTVKNTLGRIMKKLGVDNRVEVAVVAREWNLHA